MDVSRGFHLYVDGNAWCAVGPTHIDMMQSPTGFGQSQQDAIDDLWQQIKSNPRCHTKPNIEQFTIWN